MKAMKDRGIGKSGELGVFRDGGDFIWPRGGTFAAAGRFLFRLVENRIEWSVEVGGRTDGSRWRKHSAARVWLVGRISRFQLKKSRITDTEISSKSREVRSCSVVIFFLACSILVPAKSHMHFFGSFWIRYE